MPPTRKFNRESIIEKAYDIAKTEGMKGINARRIAISLGCSVQPIFHNFKNMDELNKEVIKKIEAKYHEYILSGINESKGYKKVGLAYIKFAKDYPEFFKILFMDQTNMEASKFLMYDNVSAEIIKSGQTLTGLSFEEQTQFHLKVWIFTHGIACLVATKTVKFTRNEIDELLGKTVLEMLQGYKLKKGDKNE